MATAPCQGSLDRNTSFDPVRMPPDVSGIHDRAKPKRLQAWIQFSRQLTLGPSDEDIHAQGCPGPASNSKLLHHHDE